MSDLDAYSRGYTLGLQAAQSIVEELRDALQSERARAEAATEALVELATRKEQST